MNTLEYISKGKLTKFQQYEREKYFALNENKKIITTHKIYKSKRSIMENKYYWKINELLDDFTGQGKEYFHAFNKKVFLKDLPGVEIKVASKLIEGEEIIIRKLVIDGIEKSYSSTSLDAERFYIWLDCIRNFWNDKFKELNFYIMTPDEYLISLEK